MADNIAYIHSNKLAKYLREYIGRDGTVYVGQRDGRLAKKKVTELDITSIISTSSITSLSVLAPLYSTGGNNPTISISKADQLTDGYLSAADWFTFNNKVPYTGAIANVDLGAFGLTTDYLAFSLTPIAAPGPGQIAYNGATVALAYKFDNTNVQVEIGQQLFAYVKNAESVTITKGQAVYLYQASGNKATVKLAYNTGDATSAKTLGLAAEDIAANQNGFVICQGVLDGLNTGAYLAGDTLYLGATAGTYTATKPYAPNHLVYIGVVERANNGNGQIYVRPQNGYELDEIHDVDLKTVLPVNGDVLTYNGTTGLWYAAAPTGGGGGTSVNKVMSYIATF